MLMYLFYAFTYVLPRVYHLFFYFEGFTIEVLYLTVTMNEHKICYSNGVFL